MKLRLRKSFKKVLATFMLTVTALTVMVVPAFASEEGTTATTDFTPITDALSTTFTVGEIASVIGTIIGTGVSFVLLWWGARKLVRAIIGAFKSGKLKF